MKKGRKLRNKQEGYFNLLQAIFNVNDIRKDIADKSGPEEEHLPEDTLEVLGLA
jgi:hypothetical protein